MRQRAKEYQPSHPDIEFSVKQQYAREWLKEAKGAEYYSSLRTASAIEAAEVAIVLLDASESISEQDQRVIATVVEAGRALVLAFNKWDLVDDDRRESLEKEIDRELRRVTWAARINVSAKTGRSMQRLAPALDEALAGWETRVPTAELNAFLGDLIAATPPPVRGGKQPKVLFATQPGVAPPRFVLFTTGPLEAAYRRFLERRLREQYGFRGTPIDISVKTRDRRRK